MTTTFSTVSWYILSNNNYYHNSNLWAYWEMKCNYSSFIGNDLYENDIDIFSKYDEICFRYLLFHHVECFRMRATESFHLGILSFYLCTFSHQQQCL